MRGRPQVPFERIVGAAVEIVDQVGPQALNMRQLAERLESGTATLYRHFASKDEILAYVVDRILGEVEIDVRGVSKLNWQEACALGAEAFYRVLRAHPKVVPLLVSQIPVGPNGLANRERAIAVLLASGFPPNLAARAYSAIAHYVVGFASQLHAAGSPDPAESSQLRDFYRGLDKKAYPATVAIADYLPGISDEEEFRFGLRLIVEGLAQSRPRK